MVEVHGIWHKGTFKVLNWAKLTRDQRLRVLRTSTFLTEKYNAWGDFRVKPGLLLGVMTRIEHSML